MWNFLVAGLSVGCTLVLYDGSPLHDPSLLWNLVDELGITIFGTSAKYIDQLAVCLSLKGMIHTHCPYPRTLSPPPLPPYCTLLNADSFRTAERL